MTCTPPYAFTALLLASNIVKIRKASNLEISGKKDEGNRVRKKDMRE
jgi:hypothetical protein